MIGAVARSSTQRSIGVFALASAALIGLLAALLSLAFSAPGSHRAVITSGVTAWAVQLLAFAIARAAVSRPKRPIMTAWVVGMILRFAAVVGFAFLAVRAWQLPAIPALLSFVIFLFLSTLLEPWLLHS